MNKIVHCKKTNAKFVSKIRLIMMIGCLILTLQGYSANASVAENAILNVAQLIKEKNINLNLKQKSLRDILIEVKKQTGIGFAFNNNVNQNELQSLSVEAKNENVASVLSRVLSKTSCEYEIIGNEIVIVPKNKQIASNNLQQQQEKISLKGKVVDDDGNPVAGATIVIIGTSNGAITNDKGIFSFSAKKGDKIEVSFVGLTTEVITLNASNDNFVIKMKKNAVAVDDVVVTGFFNKGKTGFAGAVTTITSKEISRYASSNVLEIIGNLDASFKIDKDINAGSDPNKMPDFTIRGKGTYNNESTAPVFILDGFQVSAQYVFDMDMNRIKTISILKDASASILYGSRAANGVVVIETKTPEPGKLRVTYNFRPTIAFADLTDYNMMNAREKLAFEKYAGVYKAKQYEDETYRNSGLADQTELDRTYNNRLADVVRGVDTYWLSQPLRGSFIQNHSLNVEGGDEVIRYAIDANYDNIKGVMKGSDRNRAGVGFRLIYRIKDKITISNYASYDYVSSNNSPYGSFATYTSNNPYEKLRDEKGNLITRLSNDAINPLYNATLPSVDNSKQQTVSEQLSLDWFAAKGLRVKGAFKLSKDVTSSRTYKSPKSADYLKVEDFKKRGEMTNANGNALAYSGNLTIQYDKTFNKHTLFFGVGSEINMNESDNVSYALEGFPTDMFIDPGFALAYLENSKPYTSEGTSKGVGFFANVNYIFDNRFFADASFRYDGNSRFGLDNKFAPFWSVGAGWNIHNEKFWKSLEKAVPQFKLRGSYGITGNQEFTEYAAKTMYQFSQTPYKGTLPVTLMGYGNPNLRWQKQAMLNIGVDLGFLNNRLMVTANYYTRDTDGSLTTVTVAPSLGFTSFTENLGKISNRGFDLNIVGQIFQKKDFAWSLTVQASHNKSKLKEISNALKSINDKNDDTIFSPRVQYVEGESMTILKTVRSLGIDPANGKELYADRFGGVTYIWTPEDKVIVGDTEPKLFGNINTNLIYKGWELNISAQYRMGGQAYNQTLVNKVEGADPKYNADRRALAERWKKPGDVTFYKDIADFTTTKLSSRFVQDENYINFSNLSLGYNFSRELLRKIKLERLKLSFSMTDLVYLSTIKRERGLDYPFERRFVFGLLIGF